MDPHTACAFKDLNEDKYSVILATAHPAKFPDVFLMGMDRPKSPVLESLLDQHPVKHEVGVDATSIKGFIKTNFLKR